METFAGRFANACASSSRPTRGLPLKIDASIDMEECTMELLSFIARCEPFGYGNKTPVWKIADVQKPRHLYRRRRAHEDILSGHAR